MGEYLSPGVYVTEQSSGIKPIEGVGTSTAGFIGVAQRGPVDEPVLITSFTQFSREFGDFLSYSSLAASVYQFFAEGGKRCYVIRTVHHTVNNGTAAKESAKAKIFETENTSGITFEAKSDGSWANGTKSGDGTKVISGTGLEVDLVFISAIEPEKPVFRVNVYYKSNSKKSGTNVDNRILVESFNELTIETVADRVNSGSNYITVTAAAGIPVFPKKNKVIQNITFHFTGGEDGLFNAENKVVFNAIDIQGNPAVTEGGFGLSLFDTIDELNILVLPDAALAASETGERPADNRSYKGITREKFNANMGKIMKAGISYCETRGDCFCIVDPPHGMDIQEVISFKEDAAINLSSTYGALYYPWVMMNQPGTGTVMHMPPSGAMAGIYAKTDSEVGVHKAPAGLTTGTLKSVVGVHKLVVSREQDMLNPNGINVIRAFPSQGIVVWGGRTTSIDSEWRYVNVRRLFLYVEESIDEGTQWVVFQPNTTGLWGSVKRNITAFLTSLWQSGGLLGSTPDEAFFVKVDEENNPSSERDAGRLNIEVGIAPVKPAEFVIIRISQKTQSQ